MNTTFETDFLDSYDKKSIAQELRRTADSLGKNTLTYAEITKYSRVSSQCVWRTFGPIHVALAAAGLEPRTARAHSDKDMLTMLIDLWVLTLRNDGRPPRIRDLKRHYLPVTGAAFINRFGTWRNALRAAQCLAATGEVQPSVPRPRAAVSVRTRFLVFQRDSYTCCICKEKGVKLVVDHIFPISRGGTSTMTNLQTLCEPCNQGKSNTLQ